jgi:Zn-dependent protease
MIELLAVSPKFFTFIIVIFSIILHEIGHGYAAFVQGDYTAYRAGRLTLNPIPHIDVIGSLVVPFLAFLTASTFFGWAKPVPYNPHNIKTKIGEAFVASAGILTNILIALVMMGVFIMLKSNSILNAEVAQALFIIITINVSLAFFNLIPIPPFDGMAIIQALFPRMHIDNRFTFNPLYMVMAIIVASVIYAMFAPYLFDFIREILL